jgi:hypothetical protein
VESPTAEFGEVLEEDGDECGDILGGFFRRALSRTSVLVESKNR